MPDDRPYPPPHWWLKRGLLAAAGLIAALLALRLIAGWNADRRLATHEAALRAAGELVDPEQLNDPPLPDGRNAAYFYRRAENAISYTPAQDAVVTRYNGAVPTAANLPLRRAAVASNRRPLADLHTARGLPGVDWGIAHRRPMINILLNPLNYQRDLGRLLVAAAEVAEADGDSAEAVERLLDLARLGDSNLRKSTFTVTHQVGAGISNLMTDAIQTLLPSLEVDGRAAVPTANRAARPASRRSILELIGLLLDDQPRRRGRGARSRATASFGPTR